MYQADRTGHLLLTMTSARHIGQRYDLRDSGGGYSNGMFGTTSLHWRRWEPIMADRELLPRTNSVRLGPSCALPPVLLRTLRHDTTWTFGAPGRPPPWSWAGRILSALAALLPAAGTVSAQDTALDRVLSERLCAECAITWDTVLSIPRGDVSDQLFLAVGPDGTVVGVDPVLHPGRVLLFGADGSIAADADVSHLASPGIPFFGAEGDVLVPDELYGMVQVFTPSLKPLRTFMTVDNPQATVVLPGGTVVVSALSGTAERVRYALHLLRAGDDQVTSMDRSNMRVLSGANSHGMVRYPAPRDETSFWSLHAAAYRIDLWDTSGRRVESLRRDAPWFVERTMPSLARLTPPPTDPTGLAADSDGLLWVLLSVADPEWKGYEVPGRGHGHGAGGSYPGRNRHLEDGVFDSVLEVVDPELVAVVMRTQFDEYFSGFAGPKVVVHYDGSSNDAGTYTVLRLSLTRAGSAGVG